MEIITAIVINTEYLLNGRNGGIKMSLPQMMQDVWENHFDALTPMMKNYLDTKKKHDDCIIFYRLGDFYEMFFDDALEASKVMEITLTGKSCGLDERDRKSTRLNSSHP